MMFHQLLSALVVLGIVGVGRGAVPALCPPLTNPCYFSDVSMLQPNPNAQYFAVGGLFDIRDRGNDAFTCGDSFNPVGILHSQAFLWSLEYWQGILTPNLSVSIGGVVFDSCHRQAQMLQNVLGFEQCNIRISGIDRHNLVGFVGPTSNMDTMEAAKLTGDMDLTLISPSADSVMLNAPNLNFFLRTTPTIATDVEILASVIGNIGTPYVAAIYEKSEEHIFDMFKTHMAARNVCISAMQEMRRDQSDSSIAYFVENSLQNWETTRYVALFMSPNLTARFVDQVRDNVQVKNMNIVFLMTSKISRNSAVFAGKNAVAAGNAIVVEKSEPASVQTAVAAFKAYWGALNLQALTDPTNRIKDKFTVDFLKADNSLPAFSVEAAHTIMATRAFVEGVSTVGRNMCGNNNNYLCSKFFDDKTRGFEVWRNIRSATNYFEQQTPGNNGANLRSDLVAYGIFRFLEKGSFQQIGSYANGLYTPTMSLLNTGMFSSGRCHSSPCLQCGEEPITTTTTTPAISSTVPICQPPVKGNYSLVYYPPDQEITGAYMQSSRMDPGLYTRFDIGQRWIIALGVLAGLGILAVIIFEIYILYKLLGTHMGQKWRTMWLGQLLLFGIFCCYLTLFAYLPVPTKATCGITRFGVGVSYSICFAVLLVKLMVILTSKSSESSLIPGDIESPNYLKGIYQFLMFVFVVGVQVVIDAQWLITVPPEAVRVTSNNGEPVWVCNHYTFRASDSFNSMTDMSNFVRNEFENHILSLVYIMFLILITTLLALNAHGIITNHRESVFIGIASGFSIPIWLAWTLTGGLNRDHLSAQEFGDACIAFGLFLTATLILFAMFLPKVRQLVNMGVEGIYFEDDRDTYYAGSVIMAPPSYKSRPNSMIYVNNQGIYSDPVVIGNGDTGSTYLRHPGSGNPTPGSTYSAPPTYLKRGADSTIRGGSVLRVTDDLSGRRPLEKKRPMSEVAYGTARTPRSIKGTLPRSRSQHNLGAL